MPSVSVVIVAFNSAAALEETLPALAAELLPGDEVIVVDNGSTDASAEIAREFAQVIERGENHGFPLACNAGAATARGELLVFLNPDAVPQPGWGASIRRPWSGSWVAWQGLVTADAGRLVNTAGNVTHFTGVTWAGDAGRSIAEAPTRAREVSTVSGACFAVRADAFRDVGGFAEAFFLYHEDTDLSLRLRLAGGTLGIEPGARVDHGYEFHKGDYKWHLLERNRWAVLVRCWPGPLLALVAPALMMAEAAIWLAAAAAGWAPEKRQATADAARRLPELLAERRAIQRRRTISAAAFADHLTADLSSDFLGRAADSRLLRQALRAYWWVVRRLLGARSAARR